jgi:hypothetical protein
VSLRVRQVFVTDFLLTGLFPVKQSETDYFNLERKILFATVLFVFAFVMLVVVHMVHGKPEMPTTKWVICWSLSGALKVFEIGGDTSYYFKNETNIVNSRELW